MGLLDIFGKSSALPDASSALPGRSEPIKTASHHFINGNCLHPPYPEKMQSVLFGMGCFWGAERKFWELAGVYVTAVGYSAGITPNPTYKEVCSGMSGHNEVVLVVFDPAEILFEKLLNTFWESHNPTQGMRQGNDRGTQYRSGIYTANAQQLETAIASKASYQSALNDAGLGTITTEILEMPEFYFAEEYHQQYLEKNPGGYCGIGGTGVACAIGTGAVV
ncbi:MAG: peptide-methionine (S)-S-oxide reductase MsrA [Rhizobiaceae bacterium]|nr:peptide-methionine (S)-S-oxide reductase MsrA [Rhizobiaceae bacterium]